MRDFLTNIFYWLSLSLISHFSFLLMYILIFVKSANEVRKTIVCIVFTNSCSAVPNIMMKLASCSDISIFAFIFLNFLVLMIYFL